MRNYINRLAIAALMALSANAIMAQETYSGYFVDGYEYKFRMNPAMGNDTTRFISVPGLANVNVAARGNLHLSDLIYNVGGKTTLFTNPGVSAAEVMNNLDARNRLMADINLTLLSAGFKAWGGYNTISINARANLGVLVPREMFRLIKEGATNDTYNISGMRVNARAFGELALGHSRDLGKKWRVGVTAKLLLGLGDMDARLNNARLTLGTDRWTVETDADVHSSVKGMTYKTKYDEQSQSSYVNGAKIDGFGIGGVGVAFDLGAVYKPHRDWELSLAVLDLGFIRWKNDLVATTNGVRTFETDRYSFNVDDNAPNSFKNEWEKMRDDLENLYHLDNAGDRGSRNTMLSATINTGVKYTLPVYRKLSFGLVNTTRVGGKFPWTDFRLSANIAPLKMLSASANFAAGTYGCGFGWMLNYHYTGFGLFLGMDHTLGKLTKDGAPLSSNASVNLGMNILF